MEQQQNINQKIFQFISDILISEEFRNAQTQFFDKNCTIFDSEEENKHEYHELFKEYGEIIDQSLESKLIENFQDSDVQNFFETFEQNYKSYDNPNTIDTLLMFTDFENFKKIMVDYNKRLNHGKIEDKVEQPINQKQEIFKVDFNFFDEYKNKPLSEWKHSMKGKSDYDMNIWTLPYKDTGVNLLRGTWVFKDLEIESIMHVMFNPDFDQLKKDYKMIKEAKFLEIINDHNKISYMVAAMPMMQKREYVTQVGYKQEGDTHIITQHSIEHPSQPHNPKMIRAEIHKVIYLNQIPGEKNVKMLTIEYSDMKGSIPKMFLNMMISKMAKQGLNSFHKQCLEKQKIIDEKKLKK